jgi:internalin A
VPEAIASLSQLQQLYLSDNQLRELPEAIASLSQLQRLYLSNNQLTGTARGDRIAEPVTTA